MIILTCFYFQNIISFFFVSFKFVIFVLFRPLLLAIGVYTMSLICNFLKSLPIVVFVSMPTALTPTNGSLVPNVKNLFTNGVRRKISALKAAYAMVAAMKVAFVLDVGKRMALKSSIATRIQKPIIGIPSATTFSKR